MYTLLLFLLLFTYIHIYLWVYVCVCACVCAHARGVVCWKVRRPTKKGHQDKNTMFGHFGRFCYVARTENISKTYVYIYNPTVYTLKLANKHNDRFYELLFYVPCPFMTWAITTLLNFLSFVARSSFWTFVISLCLCFAI